MASIEENLRATLLSLKQISDRVKSLILTSVTKSEAESAKQEILGAIGNIPEPDLSTIAKEDTLVTGISDLKDSIDAIEFDTSDLAKQGGDSGATNTAIYENVNEIIEDVGDLDEIIEAINGDNIDNIINGFMDTYAEQIDEITGM
jgi:hypothetical protein